MEDHESRPLATMIAGRPEVDTAHPFRSVREAVAVFGDRFLTGGAYCQKTNSSVKLDAATPKPICSLPSPRPIHSASSSPPSCTSSASLLNQEREDKLIVLSSLRKMKAELDETKRELMLLKERESETEIAVADLKVQLHKSMSKLAEMEAIKAAESSLATEEQCTRVETDPWEDEMSREMETRFEYWPSLAQALGLGDIEDDIGGRRKRKVPKKKPIIPLIGDVFSRKKGSSDLLYF